jgi:hypothetical protein
MSRLLVLITLGGLIACGDKDEYVPTEDPIDVDGDGYSEDEDCDDLVATIYPGAVEVCDEIDNNCNGEIDEGAGRTFYQDDDGDGYGQTSATVIACEPPSGYAVEDDDCDDNEASANPGIAIDTCDDIDNDCDKLTDEDATFADYYRDQDDDGYGLTADTVNACLAPSGYTGADGDCNDDDDTSFPDAPSAATGPTTTATRSSTTTSSRSGTATAMGTPTAIQTTASKTATRPPALWSTPQTAMTQTQAPTQTRSSSAMAATTTAMTTSTRSSAPRAGAESSTCRRASSPCPRSVTASCTG